ncbi:integrin alpha-IIb-like isoform X2 [Panulirus ornatus]|uniref:integrin alpha-IIb-like isoform X2 n=1 Tax=Panulirus ornatus TaxID=150431 RepID=UPI003A8B4EC4
MAAPATLSSKGPWALVLLILCVSRSSQGFNLSPDYSKIWTGPLQTHFGFSVALWSDVKGSKRVVIGAPLGKNSTAGRGELPLGNIHLCDIKDNAICPPLTNLPMVSQEDKSEAALDAGLTMSKYGMGFGHTLSTVKKANSSLAACAPRYPRREPRDIENRGACFLISSPENVPISLVPYDRKVPAKDSVQHAMLGFSAAFDNTQDRVVMGGPNAFAGEGMLLNQPAGEGHVPMNRFSAGKQLPKSMDFVSTYEGWSVVLGNYGKESMMVATSTVNYGNYNGRVSFYPTIMNAREGPLRSVYGDDIGAKYGYSLGSGDVDGDGATDLLVGAPLAPGDANHAPDAGKVYVYYAPLRAGSENRPPLTLSGSEPWGRFGTALTSLGDVNLDGYDDVAIAAPYGGKESMGAVYVYNGGALGLQVHPTQVIHASYYSGVIHSFGFSLDGGLDTDDNGYPDLVVGAAESDTAILIRSAPVVRLVGNVYTQPEVLVVEDSDCKIEEAGYRTFRGVCFILTVNITYDSFRKIDDLKMMFDMVLEGPEDTSLFGFSVNNDPRYKRKVRVNQVGKSSPWSLQAYAKRMRSNIGQTLKATVSVSLVPPEVADEGTSSRAVVPPVMDVFGSAIFTTNVTLVCRNNQTCFSQPDLVLEASAQPLRLGKDPVMLEVTLDVRDDPGYNVKVEVHHLEELRYHRVLGEGRIPTCRLKQLVNQNPTYVVCSFEFIEADERVSFTLHFLYEPMPLLRYLSLHNSTTFPMELDVTSDSDGDTNPDNNEASVEVLVNKQAVLYTKTDAEPESTTVFVNQTASRKDIEDAQKDPEFSFPADHLGPRLQQNFSLTNRGPSPVLTAKLVFYLPLQHNGEWATYMMDQPRTSGPVYCPPLLVNPLGLQEPRGIINDAFQPTATDYNLTTISATDGFNVTNTATTDYPSSYSTPGLVLSRRRREASQSTSTLTTIDLYDQEEEEDITVAPFSPYIDPRSGRMRMSDDLDRTLQCTTSECRLICTVGSLQAEEMVSVVFSSYLVVATASKLPHQGIDVRALMSAVVEQQGSTVINQMTSTINQVSMIRPPETRLFPVPLWVLLTAVAVSLLLILLIIAVLWKVGFFRRHRPPTGAKRESLLQPCQDIGVMNDVTFPDEK